MARLKSGGGGDYVKLTSNRLLLIFLLKQLGAIPPGSPGVTALVWFIAWTRNSVFYLGEGGLITIFRQEDRRTVVKIMGYGGGGSKPPPPPVSDLVGKFRLSLDN